MHTPTGRCAFEQQISSCFLGYRVPTTPGLQTLLAALPESIQPVHEDDLHLTLAFFGAISEDRVEQLWQQATAASPPPLDVGATSLEAYGHPQRPRTVALSLRPNSELLHWLHVHQGRLLKMAQRPTETREPRPHLSLGRLRSGQVMPDLTELHPHQHTTLSLSLRQLALYGRVRGATNDDPQYRVLRQCAL